MEKRGIKSGWRLVIRDGIGFVNATKVERKPWNSVGYWN